MKIIIFDKQSQKLYISYRENIIKKKRKMKRLILLFMAIISNTNYIFERLWVRRSNRPANRV